MEFIIDFMEVGSREIVSAIDKADILVYDAAFIQYMHVRNVCSYGLTL